jgi:hypothetical protein
VLTRPWTVAASVMKPVVEKLTEAVSRRSLPMSRRARRRSCGWAAVGVLLAAGTADGQTAEQAYKNIQALTGTPAGELTQAMHLMNAALTVTCEHCHVEGQFDADVKAPKLIARTMVRMVRDLNERQFGGRTVVTCYTCHQGHRTPVGVPVLPVPEPRDPPAATLPPVDEILRRYVQALGGARTIEAVTSRVVRGTQEIPTGPGGRVLVPATVTRYAKAPNLYLYVYRTPTFTVTEGFDGTRAWRQDQNGRVIDAVPLDTRRAARAADLQASLHLSETYSRLQVTGIEPVNGRPAYVIAATPANDVTEQWYFDVETGLLVRTRTVVPTPVGDSPQEVTFADYRDAGRGVKVPFTVTMSPAGARTVLFPVATLRVTAVEESVAIDTAMFARPSAPAR